jgi:hypothetical protein
MERGSNIRLYINDNSINIKLDPKIVNNHFSDIPIYGSVKSIEPIKVIQNETGS